MKKLKSVEEQSANEAPQVLRQHKYNRSNEESKKNLKAPLAMRSMASRGSFFLNNE